MHATRHIQVPTWDPQRLCVRAGAGEGGRKIALLQALPAAVGFPPHTAPYFLDETPFPSLFPNRNSRFLFQTSQKAAGTFLKLALRPQGPFIFPDLPCTSTQLFWKPQVPVQVGLGGHTNHSCFYRGVPDILLLRPTARAFSCSHCHRAGSSVWGDLGGFSCPSVHRAVNVTQSHVPELPDLPCGSVPSSFRPVDGGYLAFPLLSWHTRVLPSPPEHI